MYIIDGKAARPIAAAELAAWSARYATVTIDLGTGDGRFVRDLARRQPEMGVMGVDLNASNLRETSRRAPGNARFVVTDALALPEAMRGMATTITINFPWGSLLRGLVAGDAELYSGIATLARPGSSLRITLNADALAMASFTLEAGRDRIVARLREARLHAITATPLDAQALRQWPTTWAKRLAFGRDPRAVRIAATIA